MIVAKSEVITLEELISTVRTLKRNIAPGLDGIINEKIKLIGNKFLVPFQGVLPAVVESSQSGSNQKRGQTSGRAASYRPFCLLNSLGKLFERMIDNRI